MSPICYRLNQAPLEGYEGLRLSFDGDDNQPLIWEHMLHGWQDNPDFQQSFSAALEAVPYPAYFWETPPLTPTQLHQPFDCVVINSPALARVKADYSPFANYLRPAAQSPDIRVFPNLGGDAQLISPCPVGAKPHYSHLAAFLRQAPAALKAELWMTLAQSISEYLAHQKDSPLWVSTSGLGVFWLHVRLDRLPKYYQYTPYKQLQNP
jgi:hypothetical protein